MRSDISVIFVIITIENKIYFCKNITKISHLLDFVQFLKS